jgi:hypothetical protein
LENQYEVAGFYGSGLCMMDGSQKRRCKGANEDLKKNERMDIFRTYPKIKLY